MRMFARHFGGLLELEVGDFGWSKTYRVFVFDHDLVSLTDTKLATWPAVVITNPKDASLLLPDREPIHRIQTSSHIRFLAFSPTEPVKFVIEIDGKIHPEPVTKAIHMSDETPPPPLYVSKWNPDLYSSGVHTISITVTDKAGNTVTQSQKFSVDGSIVSFFGLGTLLLSLNFSFLVKLGFLLGDFVTLSLLVCPKLWRQYLDRAESGGFERWKVGKLASLRGQQDLFFSIKGLCNPLQLARAAFFSGVIRFGELSRYLDVYYSAVGFGVYLLFGPWFVGEMIRGDPGTYGLFFMRGVWMDGRFVETLEGWWFGIFDIYFFYFPLVLLLSHRYSSSLVVSDPPFGKQLTFTNLLRALVLIGVLNQLKIARNLSIWYGFLAGLLSPTKLWWPLLFFYLAFFKKAPLKN